MTRNKRRTARPRTHRVPPTAYRRPTQPKPTRGTTAKTLLTIAALLVVGLIVLGALTQPPDAAPSGTTAAAPSTARANAGRARPTPTPRPLVIAARELIAQYDTNKLGAQHRYTGHVVQTTGRIRNITSTAGQPYLALEPLTEGRFTLTSLTCDFDSETPLLALHNGQQVTVRGTMDDMSFGVISLEHCALVTP